MHRNRARRHVATRWLIALSTIAMTGPLSARDLVVEPSLSPKGLPSIRAELAGHDAFVKPEPFPSSRLDSEIEEVSLRTLSSKELSARKARRTADGGGTDLLDLEVTQTHFLNSVCPRPSTCPADCVEIEITWRETRPNPEGVILLFDGQVVGTVPGIPDDSLPGFNGTAIAGVAIQPGSHVFRIEDPNTGDSAEATIEILGEQPFTDPSSVSCTYGTVAINGSCPLLGDWKQAGVPPDEWELRVDGNFVGAIAASIPGASINGPPQGEHCLQVAGFLQDERGRYRGCLAESCCNLSCEDPGCLEPSGLKLCQLDYDNVNGHRMFIFWTSRDIYEQIEIVVNTRPIGTLLPIFDALTLSGFDSGNWQIGVRGDCGGGSFSLVNATNFTIERISPHRNPTTGTVECELDPDTRIGRVSWTNADPSGFIVVRVNRNPSDPQTLFEIDSILPGRSESAEIPNLSEDAIVRLSFVAQLPSGYYASFPIDCQPVAPPPPPERIMMRGLCDPGAAVTLGSAIFGLNHLFLAGPAPPCRAACDVNADGSFNLTDMIHLLGFLFTAGPGPVGWIDETGDGTADPTCEAVAAEADCETPPSLCSADA